jgi:hypothetical protein
MVQDLTEHFTAIQLVKSTVLTESDGSATFSQKLSMDSALCQFNLVQDFTPLL